jgi:two-component system cell cycle sensor histidine kinase/response regulator CckA
MSTEPVLTDQIAILLVEDEGDVRRMMHYLLEGQGYAIHEATDGEQGVLFANQWRAPLHLLITDLLLPKVSGSDLAQHVRAQHPETKILFLSGYGEDFITGREILGPRSAFMQKPFAPTLFVSKVRSLLAS